MPPLTQIVRRDASGGRQPLASNVDTALLLMGMDGDFNPRRIERYLALVKPAGIWPVIVLTKTDLAGDPDARLDTLRERLPRDIALHAVDARSPEAAEELAPYLGTGQTLVLLGSSGAGKSTLTNSLAGCADCGPISTKRNSAPRSKTFARSPGNAAFATAATAMSRAVPCAQASPRTGCSTTGRCCARSGATR
jgi:ribosome biogenesis GTPase